MCPTDPYRPAIWGSQPHRQIVLAGMVIMFGGLTLSGQSDHDFLGLPPVDTGKMVEVEKPPSPGFSELSKEERKSMQEMILVERFLSLPPERLSSVRRSIELIEKMSPEEKERIREQIQRFKRMGAQQRVNIHRQWNSLSTEHRSKMRNHWLSMSEEDRQNERSKLKSMTPEERRHYFKETFGEPKNEPAVAITPPYSLSVSEVISSEGDPAEQAENPGEMTPDPAQVEKEINTEETERP